jgi:hypothetical protein
MSPKKKVFGGLIGVNEHGAFDRNERRTSWTFWARAAPSKRVTVNDIRWFAAREKAAIMLGVSAQDVTDR